MFLGGHGFISCLNRLNNVFTQHFHHKRSGFKQSIAGLNSEFPFSKFDCLAKAKEPSKPFYLLIAR